MCDSMRIRASSVFEHKPRCSPRPVSPRMPFPGECRVLFRVGWEALVGSVGHGKLSQDHGMAAPRNNVHVLKRHCQNAAEAGPAAVCRPAALARFVSAPPVRCGPEGALQTLLIMAQTPPKGLWGLVGKECKSNTW